MRETAVGGGTSLALGESLKLVAQPFGQSAFGSSVACRGATAMSQKEGES